MEPSLVLGLGEDTLASYDLLRSSCGRYELQQSALVELTGDDRKGWLQGQITYDMRGVVVGHSLSFCLCSPTGHMIVYGDLWVLPDRMLIRMAKSCLEAFMQRCQQAIIMEDVSVRDLTAEVQLLSIQGPTATSELREFLEVPTLDAGEAEFQGVPVAVLRSNRTGYGGWDILLPRKATKEAAILTRAFSVINDEAYTIARLEAGSPKFGVDMDAKTLPPEMGPAFVTKTLSYSKGCYTGQEVLQRIHSRGHTNKTWMGLYCDGPVSAGAKVLNVAKKEVGVITTAAESPKYGWIAGAILRNEVAFPGEELFVESESGLVPAETKSMPFLGLS